MASDGGHVVVTCDSWLVGSDQCPVAREQAAEAPTGECGGWAVGCAMARSEVLENPGAQSGVTVPREECPAYGESPRAARLGPSRLRIKKAAFRSVHDW